MTMTNQERRREKLLKNDSIQAVFRTTCDLKCLDKFTSSEVLEKRRYFWDKDRDVQRQYIMSQLEATFSFYQEQDACNIMFTVQGHSVCPKCWRLIFAISKSRYYSALSDVRKGLVTASPDHRKDLCYDTKRFLAAKLWLTRFTRRFGDPMPHRVQIQLPSTLTKRAIWQEYQEEFSMNGSIYLKYNRFLQMWSEHFNHVTIPKCKDFTQCKDCLDYHNAMLCKPSKRRTERVERGFKGTPQFTKAIWPNAAFKSL
ncbi:uncharacterized protein LOC124278853 [Haliotis rubra]|uniref:uncharacterized protein LOC124278853 n=1 Tax=Haliotis rubra TaxID=36100 RepID=UPI001EE56DDB|nr:uncharacterized protein LOC124278853 [Haliotis rubra]